MKKTYRLFLILVGILFLNSSSFAQRNCATHEYNQQLELSDPGFAARKLAIEQETRQFISNPNRITIAVSIPVVFHVVYNTTTQNISDAKLLAQLDQLNLDFAKLNTDFSTVPSVFQPYGANTEVQFCMAQRDPNGLATNGIVRVQTSVTSFSTNNNVKFTSTGGSDAWPRDKYLNIWVCNLGSGLLGYAQFPGGAASTDGVVLLYSSVGSMQNPGTASPYNLGRTATHEVGHWLNLRHIWGDATCGNDFVDDTPVQNGPNYGCPAFPKLSSNCVQSAPWTGTSYQGDMFMNYMDYGDDPCLKMFSLGQKDRMQAIFATGGARASLLTSDGCIPPFGFGFTTPTTVSSSCPAATSLTATVNTSSFGGFTGDITLTNTTTVPSGTAVSIATNPVTVGNSFTVTLNNANTLTPGTYSFVISGSATGSPTRTVTVSFQINGGSGPSITTQPSNQSVCTGSNAIFLVSASSGSAYQWQLNSGAGFSNISGATSASYTVQSVSIGMSGYSYRCIVSGQCGTTTSNSATVTANPSPEILNQPTSLTQCTGSSASFSVSASGGSLSYQWQVSTDGGVNYSNISGANAATFTIASTDLTQNNNRYRCIVSGACTPAATSSAAVLTLSAAPVITSNPINAATICELGSTSFVVAATTPIGILTYQWQASANGGTSWAPVNAATNSTFSQTNVPASQNGYLFRAAVTTSCGTIFSTNVALTVNTYPNITSFNPASDVCLSDRPLSLSAMPAGGTFSGSGVSASTFNPRTAGLGAKTVTYTASNAGCQSTATRTIIVDQCAERQIPLSNPTSLTLYPNPNTGLFGVRVNTDLYTRFSVKFYNSFGQMIRTVEMNNVYFGQVVNMDMTQLPAGTYHLLFVNDEQSPAVSRTISMVVYK